jgi:hypothetical protein
MSRISYRFLIGLYLVVYTLVGLQKYFLGSFNNYLMFARPFHNLIRNKSIYGLHPTLYLDNYKYSPTFAWLMGPFYYLPDPVGILLWNLLNTAVLLAGVHVYLANEPDADRHRRVALLIIFAEGLITAQNMQSNNLIVGAVLLGVAFLRKGQAGRAAFFFVLCGFIKFYGIAAALFFVFYPNKIRFLVAMVLWCVVFALAPLTVLPWDNLRSEYIAWFQVVVESKLGLFVSVLGIAEYWFGMARIDANLRLIEMTGAILFLLPFLRFRHWANPLFQKRLVASFLIFIIIFNKMAESPTYVLAVVGVALWWLTLPQPSRFDVLLLVLVIVFTSLSPTDLFPRFIRESIFQPYSIKAVPCVLVWCRIQYQLWVMKIPENEIVESAEVY